MVQLLEATRNGSNTSPKRKKSRKQLEAEIAELDRLIAKAKAEKVDKAQQPKGLASSRYRSEPSLGHGITAAPGPQRNATFAKGTAARDAGRPRPTRLRRRSSVQQLAALYETGFSKRDTSSFHSAPMPHHKVSRAQSCKEELVVQPPADQANAGQVSSSVSMPHPKVSRVQSCKDELVVKQQTLVTTSRQPRRSTSAMKYRKPAQQQLQGTGVQQRRSTSAAKQRKSRQQLEAEIAEVERQIKLAKMVAKDTLIVEPAQDPSGPGSGRALPTPHQKVSRAQSCREGLVAAKPKAASSMQPRRSASVVSQRKPQQQQEEIPAPQRRSTSAPRQRKSRHHLQAEIAEVERQIEQARAAREADKEVEEAKEAKTQSEVEPQTDQAQAAIKARKAKEAEIATMEQQSEQPQGQAEAERQEIEQAKEEQQTSISSKESKKAEPQNSTVPNELEKHKREESVTSITSKCSTDSDIDTFGEDLGVHDSMRVSLIAAKMAKKLRARLVTTQLRDRLRNHAKTHDHEQQQQQDENGHVPSVIHINDDMDQSWKEIFGAIGTASKSLKPLPKSQKRDSSTWVNSDHPYMRELREVQTQVLPQWRRETYSFWI